MPSCYNSAILKKLVVFLRRIEPFRLQLGCNKKKEHLRCVGDLAKAGWKPWHSGNGMWGLGSRLWLANCSSSCKGHCFFTFSRDATRKKVLTAWEPSLKWGRSCGAREEAVASLIPLSTLQRSQPSATYA